MQSQGSLPRLHPEQTREEGGDGGARAGEARGDRVQKHEDPSARQQPRTGTSLPGRHVHAVDLYTWRFILNHKLNKNCSAIHTTTNVNRWHWKVMRISHSYGKIYTRS